MYSNLAVPGRYPRLRSRALECVQRAGEVLFVPTNWYHGIINLEPSVGIAVEVGAHTRARD
eukprot:COSAG01_NODE_68368_length_264_cov_0.660606_1_plen_60_part_01